MALTSAKEGSRFDFSSLLMDVENWRVAALAAAAIGVAPLRARPRAQAEETDLSMATEWNIATDEKKKNWRASKEQTMQGQNFLNDIRK